MPITQENRSVSIGTALGPDKLVLKSMKGTEQLGRLFQFNLKLLSEDSNISFEDMMGSNVSIRLETGADEPRIFNGIINRFSFTGTEQGRAAYSATMVPWLWFLTRTADCRIFQEKSVLDIIKQLFNEFGFADLEDATSQTYRTWAYCVQYRETAFNFISRLMEQEGIYYFFKHEDGKHILVLADNPSSHTVCCDPIPHRPREAGFKFGFHIIQDWIAEKQVLSGAFAHKDFDFEKPKSVLESAQNNPREHGGSSYEVYDYPGEFVEPTDGDKYASIRMEELQTAFHVARGAGLTRQLLPGGKFEFTDYARDDQNGEYLVTQIQHQIISDDFSTGSASYTPVYQCTFRAIPATAAFRSQRSSAKPQISGPQTAIVTGPSGEEIHTDEHGRVKVHFHWDRDGGFDENSSCWVRVSQNWAGKKWGAFFLPRIGQEVIVEFLEGDPDRPIITGRVYNGENKPPYDLPDEKTKSTMKSNSSKGGEGFNEIRFEDKKDGEQIFIHAQKDMDVRIKNKYSEHTLNDYSLKLGSEEGEGSGAPGKRTILIHSDDDKVIKGKVRQMITEDWNRIVDGSTLELVKTDQHITVNNDRKVDIQNEDNLTVAQDQNISIGGNSSRDTAGDLNEKADNVAIEGGSNIHIKAGQNCVIESAMGLTLKVGGNFVSITPAGVDIKGTMVNINSAGSAGSGSGCSPTPPATPDEPEEITPAELDEIGAAGVVESVAEEEEDDVSGEVPAATVLRAAARDGTPLCEECEKAKQEEEEESGAIASVSLLEGADDKEVSSGKQFVNLPTDAKWVDDENGVKSKDRLGYKPRFKVKFTIPGAHNFKAKLLPEDDNVVYTDDEKGRNDKFKFMEEEKSYTTDADGTKIIDGDFFLPVAGNSKFRLVVEDEENNPPKKSGTIETRRLVYGVIIKMKDMEVPSISTTVSEFKKHGIDLVLLSTVEIERMQNIGLDDSDTYKQKCKDAFNGSDGKAKAPHAISIGFTEHLAVKNENVVLTKTGKEVGKDKPRVEFDVIARGLRDGDGLEKRSLWKNLVTGEDWFVSGTYTPDGKTTTKPVTKAMCSLVHDYGSKYKISVDVSELPAGTGTLELKVNVVDRMRGGLSFGGGNLVCICTKAWWRKKSATSMNSVAIHEIGHKVGMVSDGTGKLPDKVATHYKDKGHVGDHCYFDLGVLDTYSGVSGNECVMYGSVGSSPPTAFCENCAPAVKKVDLTEGWSV